MNRLTRDGTAEPVSRDQIPRHARGQGNINFPCSADHEQDWRPYPLDPHSVICDGHTYILRIGQNGQKLEEGLVRGHCKILLRQLSSHLFKGLFG